MIKNTNENMVTYVAPWVEYFRKIETMFENDSDITVRLTELGDNNIDVIVLVDGSVRKIKALKALLKDVVTFGHVVVNIEVVPDDREFEDNIELLNAAFDNNPTMEYATKGQFGFDEAEYCVFRQEVKQYYSDNLSDLKRITTTLAQDIAKDIFTDKGIHYCTSTRIPVYPRGMYRACVPPVENDYE